MATPDQSTGPGPAPTAPEGSRVYAVGDIHGRADLLARLNEAIRADAEGAPEARKVVVYLGDYIDRGPDVAGVVDMLIHDPLPGFERHFLKGNHEELMLRFMAGEDVGEIWMFNGGRATLESYGVETFGDPGDFGTSADAGGLSAALGRAMPESHRAFFEGLELTHREGDYLFVHAGVRPGRTLDDQSPRDLMWIREEFLESEADFGAIVVHGHTIRSEPQVRANRIGIDTGAFRSGRLTALALTGGERRFLGT